MTSGKTLKYAHKLVRSQEQVMTSLKLVIDAYESNKTIFKMDNDKALLKTLSQYSDFYSWLQGRGGHED